MMTERGGLNQDKMLGDGLVLLENEGRSGGEAVKYLSELGADWSSWME